ncbi:MAG: hypothetical protein ACK4UY_03945 [Dietzia sp.]
MRNLVHLVPARPVTPDDVATVQRVAHVLRDTVAVDWEKRAALILAAVAEQLNARGGYPNLTYWTIRDGQIVTDATADDAECELARVKRELAEALGRAKGAESPGEVLLSAKREMEARVAEMEAATAPALSRADIEKAIRSAMVASGATWDRRTHRYLVDAVQELIQAGHAVDPVEELAAQIESSAREIVQSAADALATITGEGVRVDVGGLLADVHPDHWRQMARYALEQDASSESCSACPDRSDDLAIGSDGASRACQDCMTEADQ